MKAQERHHLKENEFAVRAAWVFEQITTNRTRILAIVGGIVVVAAVVAGYFYFRSRAADQASAVLGAAVAIQQATIAPPSTIPGAQQVPGTYPTAEARAAASAAALQKVIDAYPSDETGTAARYFLGTTHLSVGRGAEAEKAFADASAGGGTSLYAEMAQMGRVQAMVVQGKYDDAIKGLTDLSAKRDSKLPIDGVLIELARVCRKAGKLQEARAAFKRVVDEFPESMFVGEARQQLATMG
jgi:predicted negative regulator of RcsB-dependent stress response